MLRQATQTKTAGFILVAMSLFLLRAELAHLTPPHAAMAAVAVPGPPGGRLGHSLARNPDELDVFYQEPNGALAMNWAVGPWNVPSPITPPRAGRPNSPIAAATNDTGFLQAFYVQPDGAIGSAMRAGGWEANAITQPGLVRGDSPLAVARMGKTVWILFVTPEGSVAGMDAIPVAATVSSVTAARLVAAGSVGNGSSLVFVPNTCGWSVFYQAVTGALVEDWAIDPLACLPPSPLVKDKGQTPVVQPGVATPRSPMAVVTRGDQLHLFFVRTDGAVATSWRDERSGWVTPFAITPPGAVRADSPLAAVVRGGDQLHVFYIGRDGAVATTWAVGPWQQPFPITPSNTAGRESRLGALVRRDQLHVFYQGADGALATTWAIGPWQKPFPITPAGAGRPGSSLAVFTGR